MLIHSLALDRHMWDGVVPRLVSEAEVLTYDCRGHGQSDRKSSRYTSESFADDLAQLLDHVGWNTAAVAGCSMGGCVALAFAGLHPERVSALGPDRHDRLDTFVGNDFDCYAAKSTARRRCAWVSVSGQARHLLIFTLDTVQQSFRNTALDISSK